MAKYADMEASVTVSLEPVLCDKKPSPKNIGEEIKMFTAEEGKRKD